MKIVERLLIYMGGKTKNQVMSVSQVVIYVILRPVLEKPARGAGLTYMFNDNKDKCFRALTKLASCHSKYTWETRV